jgi:ADP-ribose pyrophosphatase YjhB (NUDIX family)
MSSTIKSYPMPFTRLELCILSVVEGELSVLLGKREEEPAKGLWALPGGVLRIDLDKSLEEAAQRVSDERIGVKLPYLKQQCAVGGFGRDPRAPWSLSVVYRALVSLDNFSPKAGKRLTNLKWVPVKDASVDSALAFDHQMLIASAVKDLRDEVEAMDLPFDYLPREFTLGGLQTECELLLGYSLDKSSFRRKLEDRKIVKAIDGEFKRGANRPAQLFKKNQK